MSRWLLVIALCLGAIGCDEDQAVSDDQVLATRIIESPEGDCKNQTMAIDSGWADQPGELTGDIDGDGEDDRVHLVLDGNGERGCQAFLVVWTATHQGSEPVWNVGREGGLEEPGLKALVEIDGEPGLEILVDEMSGASTQFVGAFTFVDGTLERIVAPEVADDIWSGAADGVFPYGGSVGHIEGADCNDDGIVVSAALPAGPSANTYVVVRRIFDIEGAELTLRDTERPIATAEEVFEDFPEFRASPFGSCPNN